MMRRISLRARAWSLALLAACSVAGTAACSAAPTPALDPHDLDLLRYWLVCLDCRAMQDTVRLIGKRDPEAAVDTLNVALLNGPPLERLAAAESAFVVTYVRDSLWRVRLARAPMPLSRVAYASGERQRYDEGYRSRGALGMGLIHDARAVAHLDSAARLPLAPSVLAAVIFARDSVRGR